MRSFRIFIVLICLGLTGLVTGAFITIKGKKIAEPTTGKGFAVVELFTSEGCSSCPPADALVAKVQKESADKPIYILAFHVDYWNRLGWKDVFSNHDYSSRQYQYNKWLKSEVYTPQIIVNGHTEFVGSDEKNLRNAISAGLEKPAKTELGLNNIKVEADKAILQYHVANANGSSLLIALIEKNATTKVKSGENGGRTLAHVQIVSQLKSIALKSAGGSENITLPHSFDPQKFELIGFVQNIQTGEITGATKAEFPSNVSAKL
ncbi:MAG TPA: DUF1223 domain-containing protein [Mucilaginibacter sp.]|jgi:hypothetical protein|nr:DUF1223 domain-containing protein [Mucilaginibacter sp.]